MSGVRDIDRGYAAAVASFQKLARGAYVVVGVRGERGAIRERREGPPGARVAVPDASALSLVEVAAVHEYGSERAGVPERSFLRATFDAHVSDYAGDIAAGVGRVVDGATTPEAVLERVGLRAVADVQRRIADGIDPPLSAETIIRKGSSTPLIDTGRLRQSIDSEVRR